MAHRSHTASHATIEPVRLWLMEEPHVGLGLWFSWEMRNGQKCAVAWCQNLEFQFNNAMPKTGAATEICDPDTFAKKILE